MMRGFSRTNVTTLIEAAKAKRLSQGKVSRNIFLPEVKWPVMELFTAECFKSTRPLFFACIKSSFSSCVFKEFKECMSDTCRGACKRKFKLDSDELWIPFDDAKLQLWLAELFGPSSKEDAIERLEAIKFPNHSDSTDDQSTFVTKLNICANEFESVVNDVADTHMSWFNDPTSISSGELSFKEVMDIWRRKFAKQERSVFSRQIKKCRDYMDRNKDMLFNDIIIMISNHFGAIDLDVAKGDIGYKTTPVKTKRDETHPPRASAAPLSRSSLSSPPARIPARSRDFNGHGPETAGRLPSTVRKIIAGHLRGISCGNITNHFGLGCSASTCPAWGTKHDKNKGGHVWKDSDAESTVIIPKEEYDAILKSKPGILLKWAPAKDAFYKAKLSAKVSALHDGTPLSSDDSLDEDDIQAALDEFDQHDNHSDVESAVNEDQCAVSALALSPAHCAVSSIAAVSATDIKRAVQRARALLAQNKMKQFFGVSRIIDWNNSTDIARTLIDPGAEYNIVSPSVRDRCAIDALPVQVELFQGRKKQCVINELAQIRFELQNSHGEFVRHVEWCIVADLGYELLLGRKFCHDTGLTRFNELLTEWNTRLGVPKGDISGDASVSAAAQPDGHREPALSVSSLTSVDNGNLSSAVYNLLRRSDRQPLLTFCPRLSFCNHALLRFTRRNMRGRTPMAVLIDNFAAHNVIDKKLINDGAGVAAIQQLDRRDLGDIPMVLLEFSLECVNSNDSKIRLREWFRLADRPDHEQVVIRGIFDADRFLNQTSPARSREAPDRERDPPPSRQDGGDATRDSLDEQEVLRVKQHASRVKAELDARFVSFHPITKHRIVHDVNQPIHPYPCDPQHASAKVNAHSNVNIASIPQLMSDHQLALTAAFHSANEFKYMQRKKQALIDMAKLLPEDLQEAELAAIRKMKSPASFKNFENAVDDVNSAELQAQLASMSLDAGVADLPPSSWSGNPAFMAGGYIEIRNAVTTTDLNGKRVRLYDKSDTPMVWLIRVLGKNSGLWKCHENFMQPLPLPEQSRARPPSTDAGFLDVAIDETGQPTGEPPSVVHRQFGAEYSKELTAKIEELKARFPAVFTKDVTEPCGFEKMRINLVPNAILPSKSRFYRNTPKMKEEVRRQIQEQLDWGAIRKAETAHCSDILLVKRPHMPGQWRFVINFQKLNDATVPEQLIMPDPASQHARLAGCKIFGALDMSSYFRQLQLAEESQYLTGFASDEGTFVHTRVPMGIRNAPSFAQRVLQEALANDPVLGPLGIKNYFDDVPFGAKTEEEYLSVMESLLQFCAKWKLKINPDKCVFGVKSITHVGFVVSEDGVAIDPERSRDIADLQCPKSVKKVQSVLGIMNYVRNFVPNFSVLAKHLTDKLAAAPAHAKHSTGAKPAPVFVWTADDARQFEELKSAVLAAPLLAQLDYSKQIFIRCDASRFGAGAVLFQYDELGRENVACYASRKFLPAETRWSTFQQEASTVVWALERFREFTQGYNVVVECDHRNISFVKRSSMPQLARWRMRLQDHDFTIRFLSGILNATADGLSRTHVDDVEVSLADAMPECSLLYAKPSTTVDYANVSAIEIAPYVLRSHNASGVAAVGQDAVNAVDADADDDVDSGSDSDSDSSSGSDADSIDNGLNFGPDGELLFSDELAAEVQPKHINAPFVTVDAEITAVHNDLSGHAGVYVTLQRLLSNGRSWGSRKQMIADVDEFIRGCAVCQKMKKRRNSVVVDRHTLAGSPFSELSIDMLKLPQPDLRGNKYCVVIIDNFSHWVSLIACANKTAFDAARALIQFVGNFGAPLRLRSDGGGEFVNGIIAGVVRMMGVSPVVIQPYTPTANGIVERSNRAILERAREMCMCQRLAQHTAHQWGDLLPLIQRSLNASFHSAIGTSPSRILFGNCLDLDRSVLTRIPENKVFDMSSYCDVLAFNQRVIIEEADRLQSAMCDKVIAKEAAKQRGRPAAAFAINDWVLVKPQPNFPLHKLAPRWPGPYRIHALSAASDKVMLVDTVNNKLFSALKRQLEHFNMSRVSDVAGLTKVAECDDFEFPVEAIIGHAVISEHGVGVNPVQLGLQFVRGVRSKKSFQFLIKWSGYVESTWIKYEDARRLAQFPGYVAVFQGLNML